MQVTSFNRHTVSECECCGMLIVVDGPYSDRIQDAYQEHLNASFMCREWHDNLPSITDMRGILDGDE